MEKKSECRIVGYLHDYRIIRTFPHGVIEGCIRCKDKIFFRNDVPNKIYLSYHIRSTLQRENPRFNKEYERNH